MAQDARIDEEGATQRRAKIIGLSYVNTNVPGTKLLFPEILTPREIETYRAVPIQSDQNNLHFGVTTNTPQQTMRTLVSRFSDQRVAFSLVSDTGFNEYIHLYNPPRKVVYQDITFSQNNRSDLVESISATLETVRADDVLAYLVQQSYRLKASDIHMECQRDFVRIRFRVDGVLHTIARLSPAKYRQVVGSIAVVANISTQSPEAQSGHINKTFALATGEEVTVNLRVETVPTAYGMDVVMRLFNLEFELLNLEKLGLSNRERAVVDDIISHPTGMVLVVGPTGSGKTTTLYALINTLNSDERKIITLEDPIEYFLNGIVQIPVLSEHNSSGFAEGLRAVLRLDPDIVMVGEIRDPDTARTALQAALTGHLVLSTFHASSAAAALTRMLDMVGINVLFSSAIHLVMAQRLVRRLDNASKQPYQLDPSLKENIQTVIDTFPPNVERPDLDKITFFKPSPSPDNPFGYSGQIAIREQLQMTPHVQQLLRQSKTMITTELLEQCAIDDGMLTMLQDGILKAAQGITSLEEIYRVVA